MDLRDITALIGILLISVGVGLIYIPAALIILGLFFILLAFFGIGGDDDRDNYENEG
ncbi:hypothetical protein HUG15_05690 [Salicibibacter cibarius]|uniref:Uncharacterized protein n=1 Tax=Salicibibacter cibarius TaxID=2743000 RepID=A0A7T6Z171_9BACI|nr:hypothetical protein [Salicibibacter cibarius]QQK75085.1 hypothetical protein HUG15_05355 [Salicibibacter cibarius]QQK75146.1 hypothetical protein HUG15_05690 [Salicibibacter cibarius]